MLHEGIGRFRQDLLRRRALQEPAAAHDGDLVAEMEGFVHVMRDEDDRRAELLLDRQQIVLRLAADNGVERAEGLVHQ